MPKRITIISLGLLAMLLLSACFKSAGSDRSESQPVVVIANVTTSQSATEEATEEAGVQSATLIPTTQVVAQATTPVATTPVPVTPSVTSSPTASPTVTPSLTPTQTIPPVQPLASSSPMTGQGNVLTTPPTQEVAVVPSSTPNPPTATNTAVPPTNTATTVPPTNTATSQPPTATNAIVLPTNTATITPEPPTNTAAPVQQGTSTTVPLVQIPSFTPAVATADTSGQVVIQPTEVSDAGLQVAPAQQTATQIIANATSTAAAQQTIAAGGQIQPPIVATTPAAVVVTQPGVVQPTAIVPGAAQICNPAYMVQIGDTLSQLARTFGVTVQAIANANNIVNPDLIRAGYPIAIPCPSPATPTPTATLAGAAPNVLVTPGVSGATSNATGPFTYTVVAGDNIYRLSLRYGVTMLAILQANPTITDMNFISEGQQIIIPGPPTTTSQTGTTGTTTQPIATAPVIPTAQVIQPTQAIIQPTQQQFVPFTPTWTPSTTG